MYAIIETGGKQHRVQAGEKLRIDLLQVNEGEAVVFDRVLMVGGANHTVGKPFVENARVKATVTGMGDEGEGVKGKKLWAFKKKRRKGFHKTIGHRQRYTEVTIDAIEA